MPQPGSGSCNRYLIGAVSVGIAAGLTDCVIHDTILANLTNPGPTTSRAIWRAIRRSRLSTHSPIRISPGKSLRIYSDFLGEVPVTIEEAKKRSPVKLGADDKRNGQLAIRTLFQPADILYNGELMGGQMRTAAWLSEHPDKWQPYLIPNPLDGQGRSDKNVVRWVYAVAEFDHLPIEKQIAIWLNIALPVAALIYSGGKSIHAWIRVNVPPAHYNSVYILYEKIIIPLGSDAACRNPARLSRMPGVYRYQTHKTQQVIWLKNST